jgi:hypothetical protein
MASDGALATDGGSGILAQVVQVPRGEATLSFELRFASPPDCQDGTCDQVDRLEVRVVDLADPSGRVSHLTGRDGLVDETVGWEHVWFDLTPWAGQSVRIEVGVTTAERESPGRAWLDNVAVGGGAP